LEQLIEFAAKHSEVSTAIILFLTMVSGHYIRKWMKSIEETREAVFGTNDNKGLKARVDVLHEHCKKDRKDIEKVFESIESLRSDVNTRAEVTARTLGRILGYLDGTEKGETAERNRRASDKENCEGIQGD